MPNNIPVTQANYDKTRIVERPDGYYWQDRVTGGEYGPFSTLMQAVEDMDYSDESDFEPGETLLEAEGEIGISDWIDPDTGAPASDGVPHLEDH